MMPFLTDRNLATSEAFWHGVEGETIMLASISSGPIESKKDVQAEQIVVA